MSEFKGTPGPWKISDESEKWNRIVDCDNENLIVTCYAMQETDDANAKLIAAAPELLQALQHVLNVKNAQEWGTYGAEINYKKLKAAINKALGTDQ